MQQQEHDIVRASEDSTRKGGANLAGKIIGPGNLGPIIFALVGLLALAAFINYMWRDHTKSNNLPPTQTPPSSLGVGTTAPLPPSAPQSPASLVGAPVVEQGFPFTPVKQPKDRRIYGAPEATETHPAHVASGKSAREPPIAVKQEDAETALREAEKNLAEMVAKLAPAVDGPDLIESNIEGEFSGWEGETIFKLSNGQIWQQVTYAYTYHYAFRPKVMIIKTNGAYKLKVDGVAGTIFVKRLEESDVIESTIEGDFSGWDGETIFKLSNGQIWQQAMYAYAYNYAFRPKVLIIKANGVYKMKVGGVSGTIFVKRLK